MGKIVFIAILYILILSGCVTRNSILYIQTYPCVVPESNIGSFDISFKRFSYNRFWGEIYYNLEKDLLLYKDSVKISYKGEIQDVLLFKSGDYNTPEMEEIKLSGKGCLIVRFYPSYQVLPGVFYTAVLKGDTVMLHTKNALYTPSGVFPLDSVRFIQGDRHKFKDNFVGKKGGVKYGHYKISL